MYHQQSQSTPGKRLTYAPPHHLCSAYVLFSVGGGTSSHICMHFMLRLQIVTSEYRIQVVDLEEDATHNINTKITSSSTYNEVMS